MPAYEINWSYQGEKGPENWGHICSDFEIAQTGEKQSPINILTEEVKIVDGSPIDFHYTNTNFTIKRVENSVHLFPHEHNQYVTFRDEKYTLQAFHAHMPSEHHLDGESYPIEWHFVHENARGEKLVIGAFMEVGTNISIDLTNVRRAFPEVFKEFGIERELTLNVCDFLPEEKAFFSYEGSLTTPPTVEGVTWIVLKNRRVFGHVAHKALEKVIGGTNRPIQELNGRQITFHN